MVWVSHERIESPRKNSCHQNSLTNENRLQNDNLFFEVTLCSKTRRSLERIRFPNDYQKAPNRDTTDVTEELEHTQSTSIFKLKIIEVCFLSRESFQRQTLHILLHDDEFGPDDVNSNAKLFFRACNCLCVWGKSLSAKNKIHCCPLTSAAWNLSSPQEAINDIMQSFYLTYLKLA